MSQCCVPSFSAGTDTSCCQDRRTCCPPGTFSKELCEALLTIGTYQARRCGVSGGELEDCALYFIARLLALSQEKTLPQLNVTHPDFSPWASRCAANHAHNYRDRMARHEKRVMRLLDQYERPRETDAWDEDDLQAAYVNRRTVGEDGGAWGSDPLSSVLWAEFWEALAVVVSGLEPAQQTIFVSCVIEGEMCASVAERLGKTTNAVKLQVSRARRRILIGLQQTDTDA